MSYTERFARDYYTNMEKMLNRFWDASLNGRAFLGNLEETGENQEMSTENNQSSYKYTFTLPGIAPDRVSVRLRSDKATVDVYVDSKLQRTIAPHLWSTGSSIGYHGVSLGEENIKVIMEHGLLTIVISPKSRVASSESVELPINGKKFLRETNNPDELL